MLEYLTEVVKVDKSRLYITVFGGDEEDGLAMDQEAFDFWKAYIAEDRILMGSKKITSGKWVIQDHVVHVLKYMLILEIITSEKLWTEVNW